jgi:thiol-disulfide isomerase/thioredoxin
VRRASCVGGFVIGVALCAGRLAAQDDELGLPVGTKAPAVTVEDLNGQPFELTRVAGSKPVLVEFWATWCPVCAALLPKIEAAHARYRDKVDFVVVAVAVNESRSGVQRHLAQHPLPFQFLWDTNGNAVRAFQAPATSYIVVLDGSGKIAYTGVGEDQDIEAAIHRVVK